MPARDSDPSAETLDLRRDVALAPLTTLELGGPAELFAEVGAPARLRQVLAWAARRGAPVTILGGGSNVVVADRGIAGVVVRPALRGLGETREGGAVLLTAAAGESWDELVARAATRGLTGLECLSGIPGTVGATPIQNVGAYGREVADTIAAVRVLDRATLEERELTAAECAFAYRASAFRRQPERFVVLSVTFALRTGAPAEVRHDELARLLATRRAAPHPLEIRAAVLELRRAKSMVIDAADENRRSVGSFFVNPVLDPDRFEAVCRKAVAAGVVEGADAVPRFPPPAKR
jgi:UDP-N-acetylmuramate dehydrogenase